VVPVVPGCLEALKDLVLQANLDLQAIQEDPLDLVVLLDLAAQKVHSDQQDQIVQLVPGSHWPLAYPVLLDLPYLPVDLQVLTVLDLQGRLCPQKVQMVQKTRWPRKVLVIRVDPRVLVDRVDPRDQIDPVVRLVLNCPMDPDFLFHLEVLMVLADLEILAAPRLVQVVLGVL
jgi:hypothetical protein